MKGLVILVTGLILFCFWQPAYSQDTSAIVATHQLSDELPDSIVVIYALPSPLQTSWLLKQSNTVFKSDLLSAANNTEHQTTAYSKALNLGIYSSDLAYQIAFNHTTDESTLSALAILGTDLDIPVYKEQLTRNFRQIREHNDSVVSWFSETYEEVNSFLSIRDDGYQSALFQFGACIESMFHLSSATVELGTNELVSRLAEQRMLIENLKGMLTAYSNHETSNGLIEQLRELDKLFNEVEVDYTYIPPTIDSVNKVVHLNSVSRVEIDGETTESIHAQIIKLRNLIIE